MLKAQSKALVKLVRSKLIEKKPEILVGLGIAGFFASTVLAVKATPKAMELLEEKKDELDTDQLTVVETVKTAWKPYVPAALVAAISTGCVVMSSKEYIRRNVALAAAYSLSETALQEYQQAVKEVVGDRKESDIQDKVAENRIKNNPIENSTVIVTGKGDTLCYEPITRNYFKSDIEKIRKLVNDLNARMLTENYIYFDEWLNGLGITDGNSAQGGKSTVYKLGWRIDRGLIDPKYSCMLAEDGTPCLVIGYYTGREPKHLDTNGW